MRLLVTALAALSLMLGSTAVQANSNFWLTDLSEAISQSERTDRHILVDLYADWCGWCKRLERDVFSHPDFQSYSEQFVLLRVNTEDGGEGTALQARFSAYSLPTVLIIDHRLAKVGTVTGYAPPSTYIRQLASQLKHYRALIEGYDRWAQSNQHDVLNRLATEFYERADGDRAAILYSNILERIELSPVERLKIRFKKADSLRLAAKYEDSRRELAVIRIDASAAGMEPLVEQIDLLQVTIARNEGNCRQTADALRLFLDEHPSSRFVDVARTTLRSIERQGTCS